MGFLSKYDHRPKEQCLFIECLVIEISPGKFYEVEFVTALII